MPRYQQLGPRDNPTVDDGDDFFVGFRSRLQPAALPPGVAALITNGRCDRGTFRPRKGTCAISTDLELSAPPVILDFVLPTLKAINTITRVGTTATVTTAAAHGYTSGDVVAIEGATGGDAAYYNGDFSITVTGASTFTYLMTGTPSGSAAGTLTAAKSPRIYEAYEDQVRGSCEYASAEGAEGIVLATTVAAYVYREGEAIAEVGYPAGEEVASTDDCDLIQFLGYVYLLRGYQTAAAQALTSITRAGATATVTTAAAHGLATGAWVDVVGAAQAEYNGIFQITVTGASTYTYAVTGTPASPATGTLTARPCKPVLRWDTNLANDFAVVPTGYHATGGTLRRMPAAGWAVEFTRRVIAPFSRTEHTLSDFGDPTTFDSQYAQLRILPGGVDQLVGVMPYQELAYLVLYQHSVHAVEVSNTSAAPTAIREITRAFGCLARKSLANCGDVILWLSDNGVTGVQIQNQLGLVPLNLPLSDTIADRFEQVNWAYAHNARGIFWNNRYYLAVPTGSSTLNSTVFVFNFLNRSPSAPLGEWESVDTFRGEFDVQNFLVLRYGGEHRLHVGTSFGYIFLMEELEVDEWGNPGSAVGEYPILASLQLRDMQLGTRDRKRFLRARVNSNVTTGDVFSTTFQARNPDTSLALSTYTATATTDVSSALRIPRAKGSAGTLAISTTAGRPEIRSASLEAMLADRPNSIRT